MIMFLLHRAFTFTSDLCLRVHNPFLLQIRTGKVCQLRFPVFEIRISSLFGINANYRLNAAYYIFEQGYNLICIILDLKIRLTRARTARNVAVPRKKKQISIFFLTTAARSFVLKIRPVFRISHTTIYLLYKKHHVHSNKYCKHTAEEHFKLGKQLFCQSFACHIRPIYITIKLNAAGACFTYIILQDMCSTAAHQLCAKCKYVKASDVNQVNKSKCELVSFWVKYFLHVCKSLVVWL